MKKIMKWIEAAKPDIRKAESGNVLFLILIAVALFAALSYAVTSSSRSGGGDSSNESSLVRTAALTQYPASVRTAIIRMMVSSSVDQSELAFNKPPYTAAAGDSDNVLDTTDGLPAAVFHPSGGGAVYSPANADVMADDVPGDWFFNGEVGIRNIGVDGNSEIIAFLPDIKKAICVKINEELGIPGGDTPPVSTATMDTYFRDMQDDDGDADTVPINFTSAVTATLQSNATLASDVLAGVPYGCFQDATTDEYVYYHVLVER